MVITLNAPFSVGDLAPDKTWQHCYITKFGSYGPTAALAVTYEFGNMLDETYTTPGTWQPCPWNTATRIEFQGQRLAPFYIAKGDPQVPLWLSVEGLIYSQIIASDPRCQGSIGLSSLKSPPADTSQAGEDGAHGDSASTEGQSSGQPSTADTGNSPASDP